MEDLSRDQCKSLKQVKEDPSISIYPFHKGTSLLTIKIEDAINKIREQIGDTDLK